MAGLAWAWGYATASQGHSTAEVGRDLWVPVAQPCPIRDTQSRVPSTVATQYEAHLLSLFVFFW